jgi:parallel beta-helix repeat protein
LGEEYYSGWGAQLHDITISGNTVQNCDTGIMAFGSDVGGTLTNVTINNNYIPSGLVMGLSLDNLKNLNVLVQYNTYFNQPWIRTKTGVTLTGNIVGTTAPIATNTATSSTTVPTVTATISQPTKTASPTTIAPTATLTAQPTLTSIPPTATLTAMPVSPSPTSTTAPSVTPQNTSVPVFSSETVYDDTNSAFAYSSSWMDIAKRKANGGSYKETYENGSNVSLTFTGQSFSVIYTGGVAYQNMDVYVDGVLVGTINQVLDTKTFQQRWDYPGQLAAGSHTLKLVFVVVNNANYPKGSLDAVIVR